MTAAAGRANPTPDEREAARRTFLCDRGWGEAEVQALPADASFRRYYRLFSGHGSVLLMDAPPEREAIKPFVQVAGHLVELGFSAPRILASDDRAGFVLLEDFGDRTFTRLLAEGADENALYDLAIDTLIALHRNRQAKQIALPSYGLGPLLDEAALFVDWYWPEKVGESCPARLRQGYLDAWRHVFEVLPKLPETLVLRDFHVDNLMLLEGREGVKACGLLDFQDALIGSPAYDLVSLLEDARRDIDPGSVARLYGRYCAGVDDIDEVALAACYAAFGAQRHAKVAGIFLRLLRRDGKSAYLKHVPRVLRLLDRQLSQAPILKPVRTWMELHFQDFRTPPPIVRSQ